MEHTGVLRGEAGAGRREQAAAAGAAAAGRGGALLLIFLSRFWFTDSYSLAVSRKEQREILSGRFYCVVLCFFAPSTPAVAR